MSKTAGNLIDSYNVRLVEAGCAPGSGRWGARVSLPGDISAVFPYLNAMFNNTEYDHDDKTLIVKEPGQAYAFRTREINIARAEDPAHARQITAELVDKVNSIWQERDNIVPRLTDKRPVAVIAIFKLLPRTNCKRCGYPTCLAYAAGLSQGVVQLEDCPHIALAEFSKNRERIASLFSTK